MHGSPGEPNYRNAQLSYRITASGSAKLDFPVINFSVESASQKLLERHAAPAAGTAALEPGQPVERTISLDPAADADSSTYDKIDKAEFNWSIEGQPGGAVEMPLRKAWP